MCKAVIQNTAAAKKMPKRYKLQFFAFPRDNSLALIGIYEKE